MTGTVMIGGNQVKPSVEKVKAGLMRKTVEEKAVKVGDLLSTGSTLLNLACTGNWKGGFAKGKYFFVVGDSASGKTFLTLTCLAEAAINPAFANYRFIYDDVEGGALMDIERFFGKQVAMRLSPPRKDVNGIPIYSQTAEDFYYHLDDCLLGDRPCIYILDSMDGLSSEYEGEKFKERKTAARKGKNVSGSYGDGKAKINSAGIRSMLYRLRDTGSILIVVNQTRDNVGGGMFEPRKTRSGGYALTFYATVELWSSVTKKITKMVRGTQRTIGVNCRVKVKKNRFTGRERTVELPIYYELGIDDVGSCVDYLLTEKHWSKTDAGSINTGKDFKAALGVAKKTKLIQEIEERGLENDLRELVAGVWADVEAACGEKRKPRYE